MLRSNLDASHEPMPQGTSEHPLTGSAEGWNPVEWDAAEEKRIENWLVSTLENRHVDDSTSLVDWQAVFGKAAPIRKPNRSPSLRRDAHRGWARIRVTPHDDVVVVRILGREILRDPDIEDLHEELNDLVAAGFTRLILDFDEVQRLTSRIVGVVSLLQKSCTAGAGGMLRLCGLSGEIARVFLLAGLGSTIPIDISVRAALEATWPEVPHPRPLPVGILLPLLEMATKPSGTPGMKSVTSLVAPVEDGSAARLRVRLRPLSGQARARVKSVLGHSIVIGRDPTCDVQIADDTVSRRHASLEVRGRRVLLRDLGSRNGTRINGEAISREERDLAEGDRIDVGSFSLTVTLEPATARDVPVEDRIVDWLRTEARGPETATLDPPGDAAGATAESYAFAGEPRELGCDEIPVENVDGVLVLKPVMARIEDETHVVVLRETLQRLLECSTPHRVVLDLSQVTHLSSRAIGVLLAHHLRLERLGGSIRLCHVPARVHAILERARLPMLMNTFAKVDDAVITAW